MKRVTFLLGFIVFGMAAFAQSYQYSPEELEKLMQERLQTMERTEMEGSINEQHAEPSQFSLKPSKAIFDLLFQFDVGVGGGEYSVATDGEYIYTAAWNSANFYKYEMDGTYISSFTIPGASNVRDLTFDGQYFYGSPNSANIFKMDFNTQTLVETITASGLIRGIAYDPINDGFWVTSSWDSPLRLINRSGNVVETLTTVAGSFSGLAWEDVSDGTPYLWGYTQPAGTSFNVLVQIDLTTGATVQTFDIANSVTFPVPADAISGGLVITDLVTPGKWAFLGNVQNQVIWALELADSAPLAAPGAPTNLVVTAGAMGALEADISFNNPGTTVEGDPLTDLTEVRIYRAGELIHTVSNPVIGGSVTFTDTTVPAAGGYAYSVVGENAEGAGIPANANVYIGEDVPAAPGDVTLVAVGNAGHVTWEEPTEGLNGGYLSGDNITYTVVRMPDDTVVAEDITETDFLDTMVPGIGNYFYNVTASNDIGTGGTAASNIALLGAEGILMYETFDYPTGAIPPGWTLQGVAHAWAVFNSSMAGGEAPELRFNWSPAATGLSRLVTYPIDVEGHEELRLTFKQYLNNFGTNEGEIAAIDVSFDGGDTWDAIWEIVIEADVPPGTYELYFDIPAGETEMHFAFRFDGDSFNINQWYIDDMILEPVVENDLVGVSITGNSTPSEGVESIYTITVLNAGTETQTDYTVKLMKEGGVELASIPGDPIEFAETLTYQLPWTPEIGETGPTFLYGYVEFAADEVPGNNQTPNLNVVVQPGDIVAVTIGDGDNMQGLPYNFFWHYSLSQTLYYPDEIGLGGGVITGIQYYNDFNEAYMDRDVMIWLGETDADDLSDGWIDPASLQLVFDGTVDFPAGENDIFINFDDIYVYGGGNLVVYSYKADDVWSSGKNFFNTDDPNSNRSRRAQRDGTPYDPVDPDQPGALLQYFPNITMFFSTAGLGALEGTVTENGDALEGVHVHVMGTNSTAMTDENGFFEFPFLLPGTYDIHFSKFGYADTIEEDVLIEEDETTIVNTTMDALPLVTVSGFVGGSDFPDVGLEGAVVTLTGYDDYEVETDADGEFEIEGVFANNDYDIHVSYPGFVAYSGVVQVGATDLVLDDIILLEIALPVSNVVAEEVTEGALITWEEPGGEPAEFRYDDGIVDAQLGFQGTWNSVMGAVHFRDAELHEMTWYLTEEGGPHATVKVWVLGLTADGLPDRDNVVYSAENVPNIDNQWNTYEFADPIEMSDGFFIGVSYNGFLGLAVDDGVGEPWDFVPGTQFGVFDITDPTSAFTDISFWGFEVNYLLRGYGLDFGPAKSQGKYFADTPPIGPAPVYSKVEPAIDAGDPDYQSTPVAEASSGSRALESFNIYRFLIEDQGDMDAWTNLATGVTDWEYTDTDWYDLDEGVYRFAVVAVYTNDVLAPPALSNELALGMNVEFTVNVTTNSGDSPEGAEVTLVNQSGNEDHVYHMTAPADGVVVFPSVWMGTYDLHIDLAGFEHYHVEGIEIDGDGLSYDAELVEIIVTPFGLIVETDGLDAGQAHFSWNNILAAELFEGFEDAFPPAGWVKMNPDGGTGWMQLAVGTSPLPGWNVGEAIPAPDGGNFMAFVSWQEGGASHNDQWLVTPELSAADG
ncbi:MAG: hypothetical protein EA394_09920, partial [Bacteroidia bacterium]